MARKLRIQYPGGIYHVMNLGDHREPIFRSNRDREIKKIRIAQRLRRETPIYRRLEPAVVFGS